MVVFASVCLALISQVFAFEIDRSVLDNRNVSFIPHVTPLPYQRYVSYEINYAPVKELLETLKRQTGQLKDRGEAHITVITPPEFDDVLGKLVTIEEINEVVLAENIQSATFEPVCVGTGSKLERTAYYLVVRSPDLIRIREAVHALYLTKKGADPAAFNPNKYYPHITLGYIVNDVHESDGLYKTEETCPREWTVTVR